MNGKKHKIEITSNKLDDFIWMSYRYCIGRKTIAASNHAATIAELIFNNQDILSDSQKEHIVEDIRKCILDVIKWNKFIKIENQYYNDTSFDWDFYSALLLESENCPYPKNVIYYIDMATKTIKYVPIEIEPNTYPESFDSMYIDLIPWVKLANALDIKCHKDIYVTIEGKEHVERCFQYVADIQGEYKIVYASIKKDAGAKICQQGYVIPEKIEKIKNINNE